ncbi:MAG: TonB-dependent receptor [Novosphingobium sp.]|nr:TonB-dependent receptor [Novosphingobium sp.]
MAQDSAAPQAGTASNSDDNGNVIVVTAQMRSQNVQDIPLSITAVSGAQLEARNQTSLPQIMAQSPSVLLQQNPAGSGNSMRAFIRGVGQADQSPSVEPGVGIYIDDIYFGTVTASAFDLSDIDRIEVLRGPQGTLAGMNSEGGAIKVYSKKPTGEGGYVEGAVGSLNRRDFKASADFTLVPDTVYARITGVTRNHDGYVTRYDYGCMNPNDPYVQPGTSKISPGQAAIPTLTSNGDCVLGKEGDQHMYAMRGSLRIAPTGSPLEINVTGDYTKDTSATQASTLLASGESAGAIDRSQTSVAYQGVPYDDRFVTYGPNRPANAVLNDPYANYANFYDAGYLHSALDAGSGPPSSITAGPSNGPMIAPSANQVEGWGIAGTIDYQLSDNLSIKSITGYRHYYSLSGSDNDNSPVVFIQDESKFYHNQFSQEVRLSGNFVDNTVHFTIGGYYYDADTRYDARIHTPFSGFCAAATPCFDFINDDTASLTSYAGFVNLGWDITDKLTAEGGFRLTHEKKDYLFGRFNPDGVGDFLPLSNPNNPLSGYVGKYSETIPDYRAVLSYHLTPDVMAYAQFSTGFKGGGVAPRPYDYHQIRPFGAEKLRAYEAGFKSSFLDRRVTINGDVFYMQYIGYQGTPQTCIDADGNLLPPDKGGVTGLCGQYLNLGNAHIKGFELETFLEPVDGLQIDGSLSLTDSKFVSINYPTTSITVGQPLAGIGKWKWSAGIQYEIDMGKVGTLTPRVDVARTPGYCGVITCDSIADVSPFTVANARLSYQTENKDWQIALVVSNLTNKLYYLNKFTNSWYASGQPGMPREWQLSLRRTF